MYMNEDAAEAVAAGDPSGGWAGLRQPDQAGQAVDADSTEVVAVGWSGALDLPNDSVDLEPRFAALVVVHGTLPTSRPDPRESAHHRRGAGRWSPHGHGSRPICSSVTPRGLGNRRRPRRPCLADYAR